MSFKDTVKEITGIGKKPSVFWQLVSLGAFIWALACSLVFWPGLPAYWWVYWQFKKKGWPDGIWVTLTREYKKSKGKK